MVRSITGRTDCMSMTTRTTLLEYFTFRLHVMMRINIFIFRYFTIVNHMLSQIFLFGPLQALHSPPPSQIILAVGPLILVLCYFGLSLSCTRSILRFLSPLLYFCSLLYFSLLLYPAR